MNPYIVIVILASYFGLLILVSLLSGNESDNVSFFQAKKNSKWYVVAFGMIGASLSGVTFISVPGWVGSSSFSYLQMVFGYFFGYLIIIKFLLPLYYKHNVISIYTYLNDRLGLWSYKTGASFFIISRVIGASFRLFLVAGVFQIAIFDSFNIPFWISSGITILLIWLYTFKSGIKTIIWTDTLQTFFMLLAVLLSIFLIVKELNFTFFDMINTVYQSDYSNIFFWDWKTNNNFFKQFFSGVFIAIVMTGLDQDMMQKNLTCKNVQESQKNMFWLSISLIVVNTVFLFLGALLYIYANQKGVSLPNKSDNLYPMLALNHFNTFIGIFFILGLVAAAYSSADSALTSLTTSFCVDFLGFNNEKGSVKIRTLVHIGFSIVLFLSIIVFDKINDDSVISSLFKAAGYSYGPLLGMFSFGIFTKRIIQDNVKVLLIAILSPIICFILNMYSVELFMGYKFGFEILILNGLIVFIGLIFISKKKLSIPTFQ